MQRHGEQQIGITGNLKIRTDYHARSGWVLVETTGPMRGGLAYEKELLIKQWLRRAVGTLAGTTENWSTASLEVRSLTELFGLVGIGAMEELGCTAWRTSSYSGANSGQCIEVAGHREGKGVLVRDTRNRADVMLRFSPEAWRRFVGQAKEDTRSV